MCSLTLGCVLLLQNVFSYTNYHRACSLAIECVFLLQNLFFYLRRCSLTTERVLLLLPADRGLR